MALHSRGIHVLLKEAIMPTKPIYLQYGFDNSRTLAIALNEVIQDVEKHNAFKIDVVSFSNNGDTENAVGLYTLSATLWTKPLPMKVKEEVH